MTKTEALMAIIKDARSERSSLASYKKLLKALKALECDAEESAAILQVLDYTKPDGKLYNWLALKLKDKP